MSYISAITKNNDVIVWERVNGRRDHLFFRAPWEFYVEDSDGKYTSLYGDKLTKVEFPTRDKFKKARLELISDGTKLYESDIPAEIKVLSQHYYNKPAPKLHSCFFDIEVDYNPEIGFASIQNPYAPVSAVSLYLQWMDKSVVLAIPPKDYDMSDFDKSLYDLSEIVICKDERELLDTFLEIIEDADVISGWNSNFFDVPYLYERIKRVLGKHHLQRLCFDGADFPRQGMVEIYGVENIVVYLSGRIHLDYLDLFKKYEMDQRRLYTLEAIADEQLPHLPKLKFEGTLAELYKNNFNMFVRYNIRDTEILKGLEEKLGYVALANEMIHTSVALSKHVLGTVQLVDMAILNECHHELNVIVPDHPPEDTREWEWSDDDDDDDEDDESKKRIDGALVLLPQIGMHELFASIDINSLYPSAIRSLNISPEKLIGQFVETSTAWEHIFKGIDSDLTLTYNDGATETRPASEWKELLKNHKWAISGYGTVFDQSEQGVIPKILAKWYKQRKEYQKLKIEFEDKAKKDPLKAEEYLERARYYDRLQYVFKIKLNSAYGALTNKFFRYFDLRLGESVTATGRMILKHQIRKVGEILDGNYDFEPPLDEEAFEKTGGEFPSESVLYGDTDSVYFKTHATTKEQAIKIADSVAEKVNASFKPYMQQAFLCNPEYDDIIKAGREIVASRGIFVQKKRYFIHMIDKDGKAPKPGEDLKIMGLDTKKTILPKEVAKQINKFVERLLLGEKWEDIAKSVVEYKDQLKKSSIIEIGLPKGVKKVERYTKQFKINPKDKIPGHIAASIHYNLCLDLYKDKESSPIMTGSKIKIYYLRGDHGKFKSIALPSHLEKAPEWFEENFQVDYGAQIERLVDNPLENIIKAIGKEAPSRQTLLVDSIFDF